MVGLLFCHKLCNFNSDKRYYQTKRANVWNSV